MVAKSNKGKHIDPPSSAAMPGGAATAESTGTAVALTDEQRSVAMLTEMAGVGFENQDSNFTKIAFLRPLQGQSPDVLSGTARPGEIINTATGETYGTGRMKFVACYVLREFIEWIPRKTADGKDTGEAGFVGRYLPEDVVVVAALKAVGGKWGRPHTIAGNELVETFCVYGIAIPDDGMPFPAIVAFASTGIPHFQKWNGRAKTVQGDNSPGFPILPGKKPWPIMSFLYNLGTVKETNKKGHTYFNFEIVPANGTHKDSLIRDLDLLTAATAIYRQVRDGTVQVDMEKGLGGQDRAGCDGSPDQDIPF